MSDKMKLSQYVMTNSYPATEWQDATPTGNGEIGVMVYGGIFQERLLLNHEELWYEGITLPMPDLSNNLQIVRELMEQGKYKEANEHYPKLFQQHMKGATTNSLQPGVDLLLHVDNVHAFKDYSRKLDMQSGEIIVDYLDGDNHISRKCIASCADNMVLYEISASKANSLSGDFTLIAHNLMDAMEIGGAIKPLDIKSNLEVFDNILAYTGIVQNGIQHGVVAKVDTEGGKLRIEKDKLHFENCSKILVSMQIFVKTEIEQKIKEIKNFCKPYQQVLQSQMLEHGKIFNSLQLDLHVDESERKKSNEQLLLESYNGNVSTALVERMFNYGRFLLIASSREGGLPANLQGVWNGSYSPPWSGAFFNNENIEMNYWQALQGNMPSTILPMFDLYERHLQDFRTNAKNLYGCRGILPPLFMDNESGLKKNNQAHVIYWTGSGGWLAQFFYDYYLFTNDIEFLKNRAIPFMKEAALFYEDFLVLGKDGCYMSYPANSPENCADGKFEGALKLSVCINPTMDFAIIKELFSNLIQVCSELKINNSDVEKWKTMLSKMPSYQINRDGAIKEWLHDDFEDNYKHRHLSHIYPLFPGFEIDSVNNPELFEACKMAVQKRLVVGLKDQSGWSLAHMANINARLEQGDKAIECINHLIRFCTGSNLFTYHNDWRNMGVTLELIWSRHAPFQIDANFGLTSSVLEMLLFSRPNFMKILPALPSGWTTGWVKRMCSRCGCQVDIEWDMKKRQIEAVLLPRENREIKVHFGKNGHGEANIDGVVQIFDGAMTSLNLKKDKVVNIKFIIKGE